MTITYQVGQRLQATEVTIWDQMEIERYYSAAVSRWCYDKAVSAVRELEMMRKFWHMPFWVKYCIDSASLLQRTTEYILYLEYNSWDLTIFCFVWYCLFLLVLILYIVIQIWETGDKICVCFVRHRNFCCLTPWYYVEVANDGYLLW